jgi:hypothetical protein
MGKRFEGIARLERRPQNPAPQLVTDMQDRSFRNTIDGTQLAKKVLVDPIHRMGLSSTI